MEILLLISGFIPAAILIIIGIMIKYKKAYWLISGYNNLSDEKKKNVDIENLGKLAANLCFFVAGLILVAFILIFIGKAVFSLFVLALLIPTIIYTLIMVQKYDGNSRDNRGKMKTGKKAAIGCITGLLIIVAVGVGVMMHYSSIPAEYFIDNGTLKITGMYGQEIQINKITSIDIKNSMPKVITKTNGSALGDMYKGYFDLEGMGNSKLFIDISKKPFIYLNYNSKLIILNCEESQKTTELYKKLESELQRFKGKIS